MHGVYILVCVYGQYASNYVFSMYVFLKVCINKVCMYVCICMCMYICMYAYLYLSRAPATERGATG